MVAFLPVPGGHIKLAERFVDPAFSFTMGWNYWYNWTIVLPAELSAAAVLMSFWKSVRCSFVGHRTGTFGPCFDTESSVNVLMAFDMTA